MANLLSTAITGTLSTTGNVGIGTGSPTYQLHVTSSSAALGVYERTGGASLYLEGQSTRGVIGTVGNHDLLFAVNSLERFRVDTSGNVGIGTTSPGSKLTIGDSFATIVGLTIDTGNVGDSAIVARKTASKPAFGVLPWDESVFLSAGIYYDGSAWRHHSNDNNNQLFVLDPSTGVRWYASNNGAPSWNVSSNELLWDNSSIWKNLVRSTRAGDSYFTGGNVGIGTTSPGAKLEVKTGSAYTGNSDTNIKLTNAGYRDGELNTYTEGSYFTHYFENFTGGNGRYYDRALDIVVKGSPDGTYGESVIKFKLNPITNGSNVAEVMRITGAGRVGIGTASPATLLHVANASVAVVRAEGTATNGESTFQLLGKNSSGTARSAIFKYDNSDLIRIGVTQAIDMRFETNDTERMRITSAGNVGIGTTNPTSKLHVAGTALVSGDFQLTGANPRIDFNFNGTDALRFRDSTNAAERMRITSAGAVGIGTTSPASKLTVYDGDITVIRTTVAFANFGGPVIKLGETTSEVGMAGGISFTEQLSAAPEAVTMGMYYDGKANKFHITGSSNAQATTGENLIAATKHFTITRDAGNVGIGTTSPAYKLDVSSDIRIVEGLTMRSNEGSLYSVDGALSYYSSTNGVYLNGAGTNGWLRLNASGVENYNNCIDIYGGAAGAYMIFRTNNSERMRITSAGNVGIGTTSPTGKLDIRSGGLDTNPLTIYGTTSGAKMFDFRDDSAGGVTAAMFRMYNASGTETVRLFPGTTTSHHSWILPTGNFGIGTTSPNDKLYVYRGNFTVKGDSIDGGIVNIVRRYSTGAQTIRFWNNHPISNLDWLGARIESADAGNYNGYLDFAVSLGNNANEAAGTAAVSTVMRITKDARVGIGTTSPNAKLDVYNGTSRFWHGSTTHFTEFNNSNEINTYASNGSISTMHLNWVSGGDVNIARSAIYAASAGNVGIGTTSPGAKLDISGGYIRLRETSIYANGWSVYSGSGHLSSRITTNSHSRGWGWEFTDNYPDSSTANVYFRVGYNGAVSYLTSGNFGIGTNNPTVHSGGNALVVGGKSATGGGRAIIELVETGGARAVFQQVGSSTYIGNLNGNGPLILLVGGSGSSASEAVYISNVGNVGIGTTSPSDKLDVSGNARTSGYVLVNNHSDNTLGYRISNTSGSAVSAMFVNSANALVIAAGAVDQVQMNKKVYLNGVALGVNVAASATAGRIDASNDIVAYSSSDERLKQNITPIENALDKVKSLTGVEFDWKPEYKDAHGYEGHDTGIIAQQVEAVMPSAVRTNDTGFLAVRYEKLIGLLIEGMKEQQAQIDELKAKLDGLTK